jgi:hypothetical protein
MRRSARGVAGTVPPRALAVVTFGLALTTSFVLALVPLGTSESCASTGTSPAVCSTTHTTLLDTEGSSVLGILAVPAAVAAIGVARPARAVLRAVAVLLTIATVLGAMSIGVFYVPTVLAAWLAAAGPRRAPLPA